MFSNRKKSWIWLGAGALTLALVAGAITAGIAVGEPPLYKRAGLQRVRWPLSLREWRARWTSRTTSIGPMPTASISPLLGGDAEGVDAAALQQA
jgi:hypothetical protein